MKISRYTSSILSLFIAVAAAAQVPTTVEPLRVLLEESGVENRFVNPVRPIPIDGRPLQFVNNTGDRTFVVTIPFAYSASELASAYAVADEERGKQVVSEIVCNALDERDSNACPRNPIDTLEGLRVLYEAISIAKPTSLAEKPCTDQMIGADCIVERLFWTASCRIANDDLLNFAQSNLGEELVRKEVEAEAPQLLNRLFADAPAASAPCDFATLKARQQDFIEKLDPPMSKTGPPVDLFAAEAKSSGQKSRFAAARAKMAKEALKEAIRNRMKLLDVNVSPVFTRLEQLRARLAKLEKSERTNKRKAFFQCRLREVEAAGKLLASYGLDFDVPYSGIPDSLKTGQRCRDYQEDELTAQARMQNLIAERTSEQGIEIANCESDVASTTCVATATIPPYQTVTFSPSVLAHHPKPRIRFTVSFFGETEVPGSANGYVTRSDATKADEKPKSQFAVQLGGDTSTSLDPDEDVTGQLRHSGSTGALSFQYTGPVEASATLQFKKGDLGGTSSPNQLQASQYQAKVYGPQRLVFQYGRIPFAKPSSGIAINIFGEGMQVIAGATTLGYVVLRESDAGTANKRNKDSDLWLFQIKNVSLNIPLFRTFDIIAVYGSDRKDTADTPPLPRPFTYASFGTEVRWGTKKIPALGGSFAVYHSIRKVRAVHGVDPSEPIANLLDGRGTVGLARISWTHLVAPSLTDRRPKVRPAFGLSGLVGYGTGDKKETHDIDEGYLGENTGFANDVLFLSRVANSKVFSNQLGSGLSNKFYAGLQYTDSRVSPLASISRLIGAEDDIESRSTVISLHTYRFDHEVQKRYWAGVEGDLEFNVEAPKNIQWSLGGAYYHRSSAVEFVGLKKDLWSLTAKLSIKIDSL